MSETPAPREASQRISAWPRRALAAAGAASFGAGSVAVFVSENGTGTGALIASGLVLGLVAATGRLPLRGSFAGMDIDLTPAEALDVVLADLPDDAAEDVAEIAAEQTGSPGLALAASRRVWESKAFQAIKRLTPDNAYVSVEGAAVGGRSDVSVANERRRILIDLHFGPPTPSAELHRVLRSAGTFATSLIMTDTPPRPPRDHVVVWRGPEDDPALADALRRGLA